MYALGALCAGAVAVAILIVGPAAGSQPAVTRTATVSRGVVQSTVSGSGNLQAANQLNLGFKTSGTVTHIYVSQGEQVVQGQLLASLDPQSAEVTLEQSKAALQSAEANLATEEESGGATSSSQSPGGSGAASAAAAAAAAASVGDSGSTRTPAAKKPTTHAGAGAGTGAGKTTTGSQEREATESNSGSSSSSSSVSEATREANLASARATVRSDRLTVQSDQQAVENTRLYAPESGTIASLSGQVGEVVSASGTTRASSSATSSSGSGSGAATAGGDASSSSRTGASSGVSSSSSDSSDSSFAVLSDLSSMQLVVALSESEIGNVKTGQIATVTIEALSGRKVAAHVREVAILATSDSGVVSYDVTFQLDQMDAGLKPGMSATAEVVVKQAEGMNVPTSAITNGTVTVARGSSQVRRPVVTGLAGDSSTIILSGLTAGETVVLPAASSSGASITSRLSSRLGRGGLGAGALGGGGGTGGGAALPAGTFFRGGG